MAHRDNYKEGVPSVTDLLKWAGYYDQYRDDPTGYYFKRGKFVEQCGTILLQGQELDDGTMAVALTPRTTPSSLHEYWIDYVTPLCQWISQHKIKFIGAQIYVYNPWETYQGRLDWLLEIDDILTVTDAKTGTCPPFVKLQTAGYAMAYAASISTTHSPIAAIHRLGLQLEPGKCTEHWYKDHKDYDAFRILARCFHMHGSQSKEYR